MPPLHMRPQQAIWGLVLLVGGSYVFALIWAVTTGQLSEHHEGITRIFDDDEPTGQATDDFPLTQASKMAPVRSVHPDHDH